MALAAKCSQLESVLPRLMKMAAHEAFFLLRSCFAVPRLLYLLRTAPCTRLDDIIKGALTSICNIKLDVDSWAQASLLVRWGGIGVRSTVDLAPSAFLSSLHASSPTIQVLLPSWTTQAPDPSLGEALTHWSARGGTSPPVGLLCTEEVGRRRVLSQGRGSSSASRQGQPRTPPRIRRTRVRFLAQRTAMRQSRAPPWQPGVADRRRSACRSSPRAAVVLGSNLL